MRLGPGAGHYSLPLVGVMSLQSHQSVVLQCLLQSRHGPGPHHLRSLLQPAVSPPEQGLAGALLVGGGQDRGVGGAQRGVLWCGGSVVVTCQTNVVNLHLTII